MDVMFRRKSLHLVMGLCILLLFSFTAMSPWWLVWITLFVHLMLLLTVIFKIKPFMKLIEAVEPISNFPGKGFLSFMAGAFFSLIIFPRPFALAGIAILTFGDLFAGVAGRIFGKTKIYKRKTLEGTVTGTFIGWLAAVFFVPIPSAIFAAVFGMIVELEDIPNLDNFVVPIIASAAAYLIY